MVKTQMVCVRRMWRGVQGPFLYGDGVGSQRCNLPNKCYYNSSDVEWRWWGVHGPFPYRNRASVKDSHKRTWE